MALNEKYEDAVQFGVPADQVTAPADPSSGDAVLVGADMPALALTDVWVADDGTNWITVRTDGAHHLEVTASGAIGWGDAVYIDNSTGTLSNTDSGVRYGYALGAVDASATTTIPVKIGY